MSLEELKDDKAKLLKQLDEINKQLVDAGEENEQEVEDPNSTFAQRMSNLSFITKPPRMAKNDSFTNYCDRFKSYVEMTDTGLNSDLRLVTTAA